jgi:hypothetical protein
LHGGISDSREWRLPIDGLCGEFMLAAWDAPGCGQASDPPQTFRMPDYAACLVSFIEALALDSPHVVGLSFGDTLALELFRQRPMLPRSLVLHPRMRAGRDRCQRRLSPSGNVGRLMRGKTSRRSASAIDRASHVHGRVKARHDLHQLLRHRRRRVHARLAVMHGVAHEINVEASERFNADLRNFFGGF